MLNSLLDLHFIDDQYPIREINHTRFISRGVVFDNELNIAILKLDRNDIFGNHHYYELPGGGIKEDEDKIAAFKREMKEEVGANVKDVTYIGKVTDYYNLINRRNVQYYFYSFITSLEEQELEPYEVEMISKLMFVPLDEAIRLFTLMGEEKGIPSLVSQRELPVLLRIKAIIKEKSLLNYK